MGGGPIFGGAYVRREICVSKSIGLACSSKEIYGFCFVLLCIRGQIPNISPPGGLYSEGRLNGGFLRYDFRRLIFGGAYTWRGLISEFYGNCLAVCVSEAFVLMKDSFKQIPSTTPRGGGGGLYSQGRFNGGFLRYDIGGLYLEGLIHGGAYFRNFTVIASLYSFLWHVFQ